MRDWISVTITIVLLAGCAAPGPRAPVTGISEQELLSGRAIFDRPVDTADIADPGLFELDDEMRAFVAEHVPNARADRDRLRRLINAMIETGLMSVDYDDASTKTARQTFHDRVGNCMSFTSMFIALAREADLDVALQTVDIPPVWYSDSDLVILNNHVNSIVKQRFEAQVIVDFNQTGLKGDYETKEVSDEYALALYFNNIAMDALRAGEPEESFKLLKKSIETYRDIAANWANLGVIYSRIGRPDYAITAYLIALDLDEDHRPSLANLAALYRQIGDQETADYYARQIVRYQNQNPYYHYYQALAAYNEKDFDTASERLERAFRLRDDEHKFFHLRGLIHAQLGNAELALDSFVRARELAVYADVRSIYSNKIDLLSGRL